jgi:hypothetical protein
MTLGVTPRQPQLLGSTADYCDGRVAADSIYALLHRECDRLFPDESFADLFTDIGRRSVPPMIVAVVMVLQRIEGCSDREAVDRFSFDARWKYAAGGLNFDYPGFVHTVLVDMRARLARSDRPDRVFEVTLAAATQAGLVGRKRVLDSTPLYDAVTTMDTVTLIRSAIRGLLRAADAEEKVLALRVRAVLAREDDYAGLGKPVCDWDDAETRAALVDALAKDAYAALAVLDGRTLATPVEQAAQLLATVVGQDLDQDEHGVFRIARRVAPDRVISTVDPEARHGHKTAARGFDGYKGHCGIDPDTEIITATEVTAGNASDGSVAHDLIADLLDAAATGSPAASAADEQSPTPQTQQPPDAYHADGDDDTDGDGDGDDGRDDKGQAVADAADGEGAAWAVYGDNAYGTGAFQQFLQDAGIFSGCKSPRPTASNGLFTKDSFGIDLDAGTVTCPNGITAPIRRRPSGAGTASFGTACARCPLQAQCSTARAGRKIAVGVHEEHLARARNQQKDPAWIADYQATRPKVERKIGHMMWRRHGGRRARVRGRVKVAADFSLLAAAVNLARLARLGLHHTNTSWAAGTA